LTTATTPKEFLVGPYLLMVDEKVGETRAIAARPASPSAASAAAWPSSRPPGCATDQGSPGDPKASWPGGRMVRYGEIYNDWASGPGGYAGAARWRKEQQRHVR
jgi:hypothetical protein